MSERVASESYWQADLSLGEVKLEEQRYPDDRLIVLWEVFVYDWCRAEEPLSDLLLDRVWTGFEELLVEALPAAERIVTPSWEQLYPREQWQGFLVQHGYSPISTQAYSKALR